MKYGTNASHEQFLQSERCIAARNLGWANAWNGEPNPFRHGTPEFAAFCAGADSAAHDARLMWPN